jgi:hypothetical protein
MKNLSETFLVNEALFDLAAPDFPLMREEWEAEDAATAAAEAAYEAWVADLEYWYEKNYGYDRYMHPELS